ncbi:uncharacterized protein ACO6RY_10400 [Pungitius sinensis]
MPYHDDEYPGQPLWQSVLLFCCKGMIEAIMVILFFWLLVQVLFTKQLEVHLQILLLVGLIVFCLCLVLGCILCCRTSRICAVRDKDPVTSDPVTSAPAHAEPVTFAQIPPPSASMTASTQQHGEQDGDIVEYPSTFTSPTPSEREFASLSFPKRARAGSEQKELPKSYFSPRRLSTPPLISPLYKPIHHSHASLPSFPKLGLMSKTYKALQRRCMVAGDKLSYNEHSRLTSPSSVFASSPEEPIPLAPLSYGSGASCQMPVSSKPCLHFTMAFSPEQQTLAVTVLSLTGTSHRLQEASVLGSLPPLYPCPVQACAQSGPSPESRGPVLLLRVSSVMELQKCDLRIEVHARDTALGELEVECGGRDWRAEHPFHLTKELNTKKWKLKKGSRY